MTFGSTFGRTFSPTFQPKSQAAVATDWWLAGGIDSADCVAAYQPKSAEDYSASLVNLNNAGTYNAAEGTAPGWNSTDGWVFDGVNDYLTTGISMSNNYSLVIKITNYDYANSAFNGGIIGGSMYDSVWKSLFIKGHKYSATKINYECGGTSYQITVGNSTTKVLAMAFDDGYLDGSKVTTVTTHNDVGGVCNIGKSFEGYTKMCVTAAAIYSIKLSTDQVSAITTAINLL